MSLARPALHNRPLIVSCRGFLVEDRTLHRLVNGVYVMHEQRNTPYKGRLSSVSAVISAAMSVLWCDDLSFACRVVHGNHEVRSLG